MARFAVIMIKILLPILITVFVYYKFCKKISKSKRPLWTLITVSTVVCAVMLMATVPPLRDTVILTALGQKNDAASKEEVYLKGYTIDGVEYLAGRDMVILNGKWFWKGETYCWRIETDTRQPDGVTRSITVKIPVGISRTLDFEGSIWRGGVQIETDGCIWNIDTYAVDATIVKADLGSSTTSALVENQLIKLSVYSGTLVLMLALWYILAFHRRQRTEHTIRWIRRNSGRLIYGGMAIVSFVLMVYYADAQSLWNDELGRIQYSSGTIVESVENCLKMRDMSPPLFPILSNLWLRVAPYGEKWLLLISIIPVALSVYVMGLCGESLNGKICGVLSAVLIAFSTTAWGYAAFEFSGYALMIMFTTLCLYSHIKINQNGAEKKYLVFFGFSMLGLSMSHYFGMLACAVFFTADIILLLRKKSWKSALTHTVPYFVPGAAILIWFALLWKTTLQYRRPEEIANWYGIPTFSSIIEMLRFLTANVKLLFVILIIGLVLSLALAIPAFGRKHKELSRFYQQFLTLSSVVVLLLLYLYGNYINRQSTMWQSRYFLFLVPMLALSISLTVCLVCNWITRDGNNFVASFRQGIAATIVGILMLINCVVSAPTCGKSQPFRESAEWLYTQSNEIYNKDTLVVTTIGHYSAWQDYYVTRCGRRDSLNIVNQKTVNEDFLNGYNVIYLQYSHMAVTDGLQTLLDRNFSLDSDMNNYNLRKYVRSNS